MLQGEHSAILWPSLGYHLSLRSLFCLFLSGCYKQVLPYTCCIYSNALQNASTKVAYTMDPDQTAPIIWVHNVCNIGYQRWKKRQQMSWMVVKEQRQTSPTQSANPDHAAAKKSLSSLIRFYKVIFFSPFQQMFQLYQDS